MILNYVAYWIHYENLLKTDRKYASTELRLQRVFQSPHDHLKILLFKTCDEVLIQWIGG